jgi:hypothetical protein
MRDERGPDESLLPILQFRLQTPARVFRSLRHLFVHLLIGESALLNERSHAEDDKDESRRKNSEAEDQ